MSDEFSVNYKGFNIKPDIKLETYGNVGKQIGLIFDFNKNGVLDSTNGEWESFIEQADSENKLKETVQKEQSKKRVVNYYSKHLNKLRKKIDKLEQEQQPLYDKADVSCEKFLEVEKKYADRIELVSINPNDKAPDKEKVYDIKSFGMGIFDEETKYYTGECYEKAYLKIAEDVTEEEKREFITALQEAIRDLEKCRKSEDKYGKLADDYKTTLAILDGAECGMVNHIFTPEEKNQYTEIYNRANPFYGQIQEKRAEINKLWLKGFRTNEDEKQIAVLNAQLEQLEKASEQWSISKSGEKLPFGNSAQVNVDSNKESNMGNNSISVNVNGQAGQITAGANISAQTEFVSKNNQQGFVNENSLNLDTNFGIKQGKLSFGSASNMSITGSQSNDNGKKYDYNVSNFSQSFNLDYTEALHVGLRGNYADYGGNVNLSAGGEVRGSYRGFSLTGSAELSKTKSDAFEMGEMPQNNAPYVNYKIEASKNFNNGKVGIYYENRGGSNVLGGSLNYNFMGKINDKATYSVAPNLSEYYDFDKKIVSFEHGLDLSFSGEDKGIGWSVSANTNGTSVGDNYSNTTSFSGRVSKKGYSGNVMYTLSHFDGSNTHTVSAGFNIPVAKTVTIGGQYSYSAVGYSGDNSGGHSASINVGVKFNEFDKKCTADLRNEQ